MVVLSPHPGHGNPGHSTHIEGVVCVRPTEESKAWTPEPPPTMSQSEEAASLSLISIMFCAKVFSEPDSSCPPDLASNASTIATFTMLASS